MPTQIDNVGTPTTGPAGTQQCQEVRVYVNRVIAQDDVRLKVTSGTICNVAPAPATVTGATLTAGCYTEDTPGAGFTLGFGTASGYSFEAQDGAMFAFADALSAPAFEDYWWDVDTWAAETAASRVKGDPQESFVEVGITTGQLSNATPDQGVVTATGLTTVSVQHQQRAAGQTKDDVVVTVDAPATVTETDAANGIWEVCRDSAAGGTFTHTLTATNAVDATTATATGEFTFTGAPPVNNPPTVTGLDNQTGAVGTALSDTFMVADGDGTIATVTSAPAGATLTDNGGGNWAISYTPTAVGDTTFTVTVTDDDGATADGTITFTGTAAVVPTNPFLPQPCDAGAGAAAADVEQLLLCDTLPNGDVVGTAIVEGVYDKDGVRTGTRTVDPVTGNAYVPQGALQPCSGDVCMDPIAFCSYSTVTEDKPGRRFTLDLPIAQGFTVESVIVDLVEQALGITWEVTDPDASEFTAALQQALQSQFRNGQTVTVTPPPGLAANGTCGERETFQIVIECRLVEEAATLVQLRYDAGEDKIQNPAYNESTGTLEERCASNDAFDRGGYRLLRRTDDGGTIRCTATANRGWETNDRLGEFEVWCNPGTQSSLQVVPTPRGTPVQEVNANAPVGGGADTIWQTFQVDTAGPFTIEAVIGGRQRAEQFVIRLSTGDTDEAGIGDRINETIIAPEVTNNANPWTTFSRSVNLAPGLYTLSLQGPPTEATGGLFTDLRAYQTIPTRLNFVNDDTACTVPVTTRSSTTAFWQPRCDGNGVSSWEKVDDGQVLTNAAFWAQVPTPTLCQAQSGTGDDEATLGNLTQFYAVCGIVGGRPTTLERVVITDQSGGVIASTFIGPDGAAVTPQSWTVGECSSTASAFEDALVCYTTAENATPRPGFRREAPNAAGTLVVTFLGQNGEVVTPDSWTPGSCEPVEQDTEVLTLCDGGRNDAEGDPQAFLRRLAFARDGSPVGTPTDLLFDGTPYTVAGPVVACPGHEEDFDVEETLVCAATGDARITTPALRRVVFVNGVQQSEVFLDAAGAPFVPNDGIWQAGGCPEEQATTTLVCADGVPTIRVATYISDTLVRESFTQQGNVAVTPTAWVAGPCPGAPDVEWTESLICADGTTMLLRRAYSGTVLVQELFITANGQEAAPTPNAWTPGPCVPPDPAPITLRAQSRLVRAGDPAWTPANDVIDRLTSLSVTILSGSGTVTDYNGTVSAPLPAGLTLTWNAEDATTLQGPQSVAPITGSLIAAWTEGA